MSYLVSIIGNISLLTMGFQPLAREAYGPIEPVEAAMLRAPGCWIQAIQPGEGGMISEGDVAVFDCKIVDDKGNILLDTGRRGIPMTVRVKSQGLWNIVLHQMAREEERIAVIGKDVLPEMTSDLTISLKMKQIVRSKSLARKSSER